MDSVTPPTLTPEYNELGVEPYCASYIFYYLCMVKCALVNFV